MANSAISWASQRQKTVTLSVGEAEYMELASTGRQAAWLKSFSGEIVEMEYREMLFQLETKQSDKELYRIIAQSRAVQMISY